MKEKLTIGQVFGKILYVLDCIILFCLLIFFIGIFGHVIAKEIPNPGRLQDWLFPLFGGFILFFVTLVIPRIRSNVKFLMSFMHEFTHMIVAMVFLRKVLHFQVDDKDCHVTYDNGPFNLNLGYNLITLSPYFFPILALAMLPWRFTVNGNDIALHIIDAIIGLMWAFHVCCWIKQTRFHQTDLIGPGLVRSVLVIAVFHFLNACLILSVPASGVERALTRVFGEYAADTFIIFSNFFKHCIQLIGL